MAEQNPLNLAAMTSQAATFSSTIPANGVIGSRRIYPVRTSAASPSVVQLELQQQQQASSVGQKRYRADLSPGGFRSQSRRWVDRNPRSRENVMRAALEELLGHPFVKVRPAFLLNPATKRRLELDAYCEALCLAMEFDGEQHHIFPNACHSTREDFEKQQYRDRLKVTLCRQHGVTLVVVPSSVTRSDMTDHLKRELIRLGFPLVNQQQGGVEASEHGERHEFAAGTASGLASDENAQTKADATASQEC